jgi:hypothetical protein
MQLSIGTGHVHHPQTLPAAPSTHPASHLVGGSSNTEPTGWADAQTKRDSIASTVTGIERDKKFYTIGHEVGLAEGKAETSTAETTGKGNYSNWKKAGWVSLFLALGIAAGLWYQHRKDKPKIAQLAQLQTQLASGQ